MKARHLLAAAALLAALAGCGSSSDEAPTTTPTTPNALTSADMEKAAAAAGIPPKPDEKTAAAYLAALRKIDPEIVESTEPDRLINRGRDQCTSIKEWPNDQAKLIKWANTRFSSPNHPNGFGDIKATKINEVVRQYICPTY